MDFSVIEQHPWATAGIIGIGGLGLYLLLRGRSGGGSDGGGGGVTYVGGGQPSDAAVAANAATTNAQLAVNAKVSEYSAAIEMAKISAGVSNYGTWAALAAQQGTTGAELTYGLSAQQTAIELARIDAGVQSQYIDKLSGVSVATAPARQTLPTPETLVYQPIAQPIAVQAPAVTVGGPVIPGGTQLVSLPDYADCSPWDSRCVANNGTLNTNYNLMVEEAQRTNNYNQCVSNAANANSPEQYAAVMAACTAARG